jgi:hypothetical protein
VAVEAANEVKMNLRLNLMVGVEEGKEKKVKMGLDLKVSVDVRVKVEMEAAAEVKMQMSRIATRCCHLKFPFDVLRFCIHKCFAGLRTDGSTCVQLPRLHQHSSTRAPAANASTGVRLPIIYTAAELWWCSQPMWCS